MKPIVLGLTGSIAMGKSTVGAMLENLGIPVHDADTGIHQFLEPDNPARIEIAAAFPYYEYPDLYMKKTRAIDRTRLGALVFADDELREQLEEILHPLVEQDQQEFIALQGKLGRSIVALDTPLLFEIGADKRVDYTLVASAPLMVQRERALERPDMTQDKLDSIIARQIPDLEKQKRADYVIKTGLGRGHSMRLLKEALYDIRIKAGLIPDPEEEYEESEETRNVGGV